MDAHQHSVMKYGWEMTNSMKSLWKSGDVAYGAWLALPDRASAEIVARTGWDYCCIDMQHGLADFDTALSMLQAINLGPSSPTIRVPWNEQGIIGRCLDAGAMNLIVPMVNSVEEAQAAVHACRYPPEGTRSFGPLRAAMQEGPGYFVTANNEIACIPMIETAAAVDALDDILSVDGIDAVYVGPSDLAISYGLGPGDSDDDDVWTSALTKVVARCEVHGVVPGIHSNPALAKRRVDQGFRMVTVASDAVVLATTMANELAAISGARPARM